MLFSGKLAILHYDTPHFDVVQRGDYVLCAVTGERISLDHLRYWSVERQEAYRGSIEAHAAQVAGGAANLRRSD
ncbi:DUF2093 domain-containing protein [Sphingomonas sp. SRS2]|uniref:DUF2093 domain-containing protein n=1 Tax=Sphingomonas sp. SRS2 TaxID=133190 RepID=UPI0006184D3D|nr:DUF2093 domain-containing protein [Sphingomonas sp. SRS2]KKC27849.1 hypothetical protein WP12_01360 [Sphingomonas sp. SRS2]